MWIEGRPHAATRRVRAHGSRGTAHRRDAPRRARKPRRASRAGRLIHYNRRGATCYFDL